MDRTDLFPLAPQALSAKLQSLVGEERSILADFLLHLAELDRRRAYAELGYGSLWDYCLRALHLREGAAGRRIGAMRVLRRFPQLEAAIRDGRLCLSTLSLLGQVLTEANVSDLLERAAFKSKADVDALVASLRPRPEPAEGVRRTCAHHQDRRPEPPALVQARLPACGGITALPELAFRPPDPGPDRSWCAPQVAAAPEPARLLDPAMSQALVGRPPGPTSPDPERWSVRVTLSKDGKALLDTLRQLLAHKLPGGELGTVIEEALRCAVEKHGKRRGLVVPRCKPPAKEPAPARRGPVPAASPRHLAIAASVRREVWARDAGRCTFVAPDGTRCESRWKLELDHVRPLAMGGPSDAANLRLRCRTHNLLHAENVYGRACMDRHRRREPPRAGLILLPPAFDEPSSTGMSECAGPGVTGRKLASQRGTVEAQERIG